MGRARAPPRYDGQVMASRTRVCVVGAGIGAGLLLFAFVAAPHSCDWGLDAYVAVGAASIGALIVLPYVLRMEAPPGQRALLALAFVAAGGGVWLLGLIAANVRIVCRLI